MAEVVEFVRTTDAPDSTAAQHAVKLLARAEGYTVRTVRSVRPVPHKAGHPRYTVTLAVVPAPLGRSDCE